MDYSQIATAFIIGLPAFIISVYSMMSARKKVDADAIKSLNETVVDLLKGRREMLARLKAIEKKQRENDKLLAEYVAGSETLYNQVVRLDDAPEWIPPHIINPTQFESAKWD
ncbi:MAG: hypothetical protein DSY80_08930 [Desulfocapsa sp.]|nr:MAG: hypothetical protein DSY80_08930 [Desulfocapsa sp.]